MFSEIGFAAVLSPRRRTTAVQCASSPQLSAGTSAKASGFATLLELVRQPIDGKQLCRVQGQRRQPKGRPMIGQ